MAQSSGSVPTLKVKTCFCFKMFDVAHLNGENGPGGHLHMRPFQFQLKEHWSFSLVIGHPPSLVRDHFSSPGVMENPSNVMKCAQTFTPKTTVYKSLQTPKTKVGALTQSKSLQKVCGQTGI